MARLFNDEKLLWIKESVPSKDDCVQSAIEHFKSAGSLFRICFTLVVIGFFVCSAPTWFAALLAVVLGSVFMFSTYNDVVRSYADNVVTYEQAKADYDKLGDLLREKGVIQ